MKLDEEMYSQPNKVPVIPILVGVIGFALLIGLVVLGANGGLKPKKAVVADRNANTVAETVQVSGQTEPSNQTQSVGQTQPSSQTQSSGQAQSSGQTQNSGGAATDAESGSERERLDLGGSHITAQDLNFWDMYPEKEETQEEKKKPTVVKPKPAEEEESDPSKDGKHVQVTLDDGSKEWLAINKSLQKNTYDLTCFQREDQVMKYYQNEQNISYAGVTLNRYSGEVDFAALKKKGITFAMIRCGSRGYESGVITVDDNFATYMQQATEAGLNVGVYFATQAISAEEAAEEVNFMINQCAPYKLTYPMAVKVDVIRNDSSRTESLSKNDRATILKTYIEAITAVGQKPMVMATRNDLLTKIDLVPLTGCSIWLDQPGTMPDYPYAYQIWQYADGSEVPGAGENVKLNISLVDYASR